MPFAILLLALTAADFDWALPKGFPRPRVPADNPMSAANVELGRHLFYDKRMSGNGTQSCASCHRQELAFTDGKARAVGSTGQMHARGSMSLVNVAYAPLLTWANPEMAALEEQALIPMLGAEPIELGLRKGAFLQVLQDDPAYRALFRAASLQVSLKNAVKALAAFERSIVSMRSPYDRYRYGGDRTAISDAAKRGELLYFLSERGGCFQCHGGWNLSGAVQFEGGADARVEFHDTGLYPDGGKFRAPTLRNIAVTGPYMHDGSVRTLEDAIDHYAAGGRAAGSPAKSPIVRGFAISKSERHDLIEFLKTFTDAELLRDPRWSDPWPH